MAAGASNKFATMLHNSNTPKIFIVLIYTLLEWVLIALLLLDGLFSYFIAEFAEFFGLEPPCFLCSHALGRSSSSSYKEILCDSHAGEIAGIGYCSRHRNLARASRMCEDCSSSKPTETSWMARAEEEGLRCSCCSVVLETGFYEITDEKLNLAEKPKESLLLDEKPLEKSNLVEKPHENLLLDRSGDVNCVNELAQQSAMVDLVDSSTLLEEEEVKIDNSINVGQEGADCKETAEFGKFQAACEEEKEEETKVAIAENICEIPIESAVNDHDETMGRGTPNESITNVSHHELVGEVEEERVPETPTSVDSFHALRKRLLFERREFGALSLDGGSVASEIDGNELSTVDHLKAALKAERMALSVLYSELEEERSASAIAANQTMAMITRLQEEKAAMQMEAVQYQRMMEEQSEYDQEALQLLNDLMMKREKELEVYRKKVLDYEAKERRNVAPRTNRTSSASSSADESNDLSSEDFDYSHSDALNFETDKHMHALDDSLADFEDERYSILEQLKALEGKLFSLNDSDDEHHFPEQNGHGINGDDGFVKDSDTNGKLHHELGSVPVSGKRLLPLFDAVDNTESENGSPDSLSKSIIHNNHKKLAIAEEVDNVYERLQALEADREFIKHCLESLKKGDKGMDLLREILQHLRDLRSVQLRVRDAGYAHTSLSA